MNAIFLAAGLLVYVILSRFILRNLAGSAREFVLAIVNLAGVLIFLFQATNERYANLRFAVYVVLVVFQYLMLVLFVGRKGRLPWLAFFAPIAVLILVRYVPLAFFLQFGKKIGLTWYGNQSNLALVGISYLAFRCSRLALEVRNGAVSKPGFWAYLHYAFFLPTMSVGPINTYANYRQGFAPNAVPVPVGPAALRILVGWVKYEFIGGLFGQLTYQGFLLNDHPHHWIDLPIAMVCYFLFLYCNFSGFCDMAIGAAAIIGIPVPENFDDPFAARNMREFWNRWHITLSAWMRDVVFSPLSKSLVRFMGVRYVNHAVAIAIFVVFLLIGIWHGVGWNYVLFGLAQSVGVTTVHYYTLFLKKHLGRDGFKAYNQNRWIHAVAVVITFCYYAATLFLFANSVAAMKEIFAALR